MAGACLPGLGCIFATVCAHAIDYVVYGRSLGSGLAAEMGSANHAPDLTVLVSPYTSMAAVAGDHYPLVPHASLAFIKGAAHNDLQNFDTYLDLYAKALAKL